MASSSRANTSAVTTFADANVQKLLECPICLEVTTKPKLLGCGHSVCQGCEANMSAAQGPVLTCPVCRVETDVPIGGLPVNYSMCDLIEHLSQNEARMRFECAMCIEKGQANKMFRCNDCGGVILCAYCTTKHHTGHNVNELAEIVEQRRQQVKEWREGVDQQLEEVATFANRLNDGRQELVRKSKQTGQFLIRDVVKYAQRHSKQVTDGYNQFKIDLEKFVSCADQETADLLKCAADDCSAQDLVLETTKQTVADALEKKDRVIAIMENAEREIREIFAIPVSNGAAQESPPDQVGDDDNDDADSYAGFLMNMGSLRGRMDALRRTIDIRNRRHVNNIFDSTDSSDPEVVFNSRRTRSPVQNDGNNASHMRRSRRSPSAGSDEDVDRFGLRMVRIESTPDSSDNDTVLLNNNNGTGDRRRRRQQSVRTTRSPTPFPSPARESDRSPQREMSPRVVLRRLSSSPDPRRRGYSPRLQIGSPRYSSNPASPLVGGPSVSPSPEHYNGNSDEQPQSPDSPLYQQHPTDRLFSASPDHNPRNDDSDSNVQLNDRRRGSRTSANSSRSRRSHVSSANDDSRSPQPGPSHGLTRNSVERSSNSSNNRGTKSKRPRLNLKISKQQRGRRLFRALLSSSDDDDNNSSPSLTSRLRKSFYFNQSRRHRNKSEASTD